MSALRKEYEAHAQQMLEHFKDHVLTVDERGVVRMGRPNSGTYSIFLVEFGGAIAMTGDTIIGHNGIISTRGYTLPWLRDATDTYLASKFLKERFSWEIAEIEMKEMIAEYDACGGDEDRADYSIIHKKTYEAFKELLAHGPEFNDSRTVYDAWMTGERDLEGIPGWGYDIYEFGTLQAIQRLYRRLTDEAEAAAPPV